MAQAKHGFSPDKVASFKEAFDLWNSDGDSHLDVKELTAAMKNLGSFDDKSLTKILEQVCHLKYIYIFENFNFIYNKVFSLFFCF